MANSTGSADRTAEPALIYDAGERRTHDEHAAEAYDSAQRADALQALADAHGIDNAHGRHLVQVAERTAARAQFHATMATYHAIVDQGWR